MSSLKLRKIAKIVKEMNTSPSQSRYDISGLTLGLCKFFYRTSQHLFQDLGQGDYTIDTSSNSQVLVIQNSELLKNMEAIQVCYILDTTSSKYETDFNVDINQLKDEYNHLVDDVHALWDYVKKVGIVADDATIPLILPQLNNDEMWVKTEDGYKGISLTDAEGVIKEVILNYTNEMKDVLDKYAEDPLKVSLDDYEKEKEEEIKVLITQISDNIALQVHDTKLNIGDNTIILPDNWILSERLTIHLDGILLTRGEDYSLNRDSKSITLTHTYDHIANIHIEDMLPITYTEQLRAELVSLIDNAKRDIQSSTDTNLEQISNKGSEMVSMVQDQGEMSKQYVINQESVSLEVIKAQEDQSKQNIKDYVNNTSLQEIDQYIEENKANLKGDKGDQGEKGDKGDAGEKGADGVVTEVKGFIGFQIRNGDLYVKYTGDETPSFRLNEDGDLIYTI